jgi:excisionase family DNA binding protein
VANQNVHGEGKMNGLMTKGEVAGMLKVSVRTVDRLRAAGELKAVKVRSGVRFDLLDVLDYLQKKPWAEDGPLYAPCRSPILSGDDLMASVTVDEPCDAPTLRPKSEWVCGNSSCKLREVVVQGTCVGDDPKDHHCPKCGRPLRFITYLQENCLVRVRQ